MLIAGRTREIALLRLLGATRRQVLGSVLLEATVMGLVAAAAGVAVGVGERSAWRCCCAGWVTCCRPADWCSRHERCWLGLRSVRWSPQRTRTSTPRLAACSYTIW